MAPPQQVRDHMEGVLTFFNVIQIIASLIILGICIFLTITLNAILFAISLSTAIIVSLVFSIILFTSAIFGILGTVRDNNTFIGLYVGGSLISGVALLMCGSFMFTYREYFDSVASGRVDVAVEAEIMNLELAIFTECCDTPDRDVQEIFLCEEVNNVFPCIQDEAEYIDFLGFVTNTTCGVLSQLEYVGDPEDGRCGFGSAEIFLTDVSVYLREKLQVLATVNVVISMILFVSQISACYLLWTKDVEKKQNH